MSHEPHPDHEEILSVVETANLSAIESVNRKLIDLVDKVYDLDENSAFEFGDDNMYSRCLPSVRGAMICLRKERWRYLGICMLILRQVFITPLNMQNWLLRKT